MTENGEARRRRYKYGRLLRDPDVRRWHENLARRSEVTADVYLRGLGWFCRTRKLTPAQLAAMGVVTHDSLIIRQHTCSCM